MFGNKKKISISGSLISGLPIPEGSCVVVKPSVEGFRLVAIISQGKAYTKEFDLALNKIISVKLLNEQEIEKVIEQSVPGMILGYAAFGVIGAMVGGRVKTKEKTQLKQILLIDYVSEEKKQIVLDCSGETYFKQSDFMKYVNQLMPPSMDNTTVQI